MNWGRLLQPSASGTAYLGWMFAGFKMTIGLSLTAWVDCPVAWRS